MGYRDSHGHWHWGRRHRSGHHYHGSGHHHGDHGHGHHGYNHVSGMGSYRPHRASHGAMKGGAMAYAPPQQTQTTIFDQLFHTSPDTQPPASGRIEHVRPSAALHNGDANLVYHVSSGKLELDGRVYSAGSGRGAGRNNPSMQFVNNVGPVPAGDFNVTPREAAFYGDQAWRLHGTANRAGVLIHSDAVGVRGGRKGDSLGCIAVDREQYAAFKQQMNNVRPRHIIVRPD